LLSVVVVMVMVDEVVYQGPNCVLSDGFALLSVVVMGVEGLNVVA
jgi:hypothetical protein